MNPRLSYEESCRKLQPSHVNAGDIPPMPDRLPQYDDPDPLGVSFFRMMVCDDFSNLTLPRTFFGRSQITGTAFRNTDLTESNLCWNDFINVDFTDAILAKSDLRAALFSKVKFVSADLSNADLRRSTFEHCDFTRARMDGAILTHDQAAALGLCEEQRTSIFWVGDDGPEPAGG